MKTFLFSISILSALVATTASAQQQTVLRDSGGRNIGTTQTDSQGTTTFRDGGGRTTGTASTPGLGR